MIKNIMYPLIAILLILAIPTGIVFADDIDVKGTVHDLTIHANWTGELYDAKQNFMKGDYKESINIYDDYLEYFPNDVNIKAMKGIALNNLRLGSTLAAQPSENFSFPSNPTHLNKLSMLEFYEILKLEPHNIIALNGMGLGFGNYGEYEESKKYFKKTLDVKPDDKIAKNYIDYIEKVEKKFITSSTEKPEFLKQLEKKEIPDWVKNNAGWWADGQIDDGSFVSGIQWLISNGIMIIPSTEQVVGDGGNVIPDWIKNNAKWWSDNKISDDDFLSGIKYLVENNIIKLNSQRNSELVVKELERKAWNFEQYIRDIQIDIKKQNRYVENINPSEYVIIKYWKDYSKWNLAQFLNNPDIFPDRKIWVDPETDRYVIEYLVYINEQPVGLPIDHVTTLVNSFDYWEKREFVASDGKKAIAKFSVTNKKAEANVWVTWVVRNIGEGVLGHANIGKGVVEVAIGGYGCDGSFQLFGTDTVEYVMTHELGHSLGFNHSNNSKSIMYHTVPHVDYAYCLLG